MSTFFGDDALDDTFDGAGPGDVLFGGSTTASAGGGNDTIDGLGITAADVAIVAAGGFTSAVYANTDGIAGYDLALVATGTTASIQLSDLLL